jgi:hypothetical protein
VKACDAFLRSGGKAEWARSQSRFPNTLYDPTDGLVYQRCFT